MPGEWRGKKVTYEGLVAAAAMLLFAMLVEAHGVLADKRESQGLGDEATRRHGGELKRDEDGSLKMGYMSELGGRVRSGERRGGSDKYDWERGEVIL